MILEVLFFFYLIVQFLFLYFLNILNCILVFYLNDKNGSSVTPLL